MEIRVSVATIEVSPPPTWRLGRRWRLAYRIGRVSCIGPAWTVKEKQLTAWSLGASQQTTSERNTKHPNPKLQRSPKSQAPNPKIRCRGKRRQVFQLGAWCFFGVWSLELDAWALSFSKIEMHPRTCPPQNLLHPVLTNTKPGV